MSRCTGHCCKNFPLPIRPDELPALQAAIDNNTARRFADQDTIIPMLIYLGPQQYPDGRAGGRYTCKHLQPNNDCAIYETRPRMCSEYPYGNPCDHVGKGCTYEPEQLVKIGDADAKAAVSL